MNIEEYNKVSSMDYEAYCDYLQNKYGKPDKPYYTKGFSKNRSIVRSKEGLVIHHKKENVAIMLANVNYAKNNPYEYQMPDNLVYCDYLEHLLLHVLICEDIIIGKTQNINENEKPGVGGVINFLMPELNDMYSGYESSQEWKKNCYLRVINDRKTYLKIVERFIQNYWKPLDLPFVTLTRSYHEQFGKWDKDINLIINEEIEDIYNSI